MSTVGSLSGLGVKASHQPGGTVTLTVRGELDLATAQRLRVSVLDAMARYGPHVVLDVAGLSFCDVVGLQAIRDCAAEAAARGGGMSLIGISDQLRRLMEISGLHQNRWPPRGRPSRTT